LLEQFHGGMLFVFHCWLVSGRRAEIFSLRLFLGERGVMADWV
jgi:hypothetical protein